MSEVGQRPGSFDALRLWWERESRRPTGGSFAARANQIWRRRDVLRMLVVRDLKRKYENSYLGWAWTLLEPALLIGIYWLVWGHIAKQREPHYVLFLATAMMPWLWFRSCVNGATDAITGNARLVTSISLPREIYPLALVATKMFEFFITLPLIWIVAAFYGVAPTIYLAFLPLVILLELTLVIGVALFLSAMTALFRDIDRGLHAFMRVLFYLTPVLYPTGRLHGKIHALFVINPLVGIFDLHRRIFYSPPHISVTWHQVVISVVGSVLAFVGGWWTFIRLERPMLKEL